MSETASLFQALRQAVDPAVAVAIEQLVREGPDRALSRINVLDFAARTGLDEELVLAGFLHAARLKLFDLSWNVLCPGCSGVLNAGASLKSVDHHSYHCALCAAGYEPTLDEMVEVTLMVNPRVRRITAHAPHELPPWEYYRQVFWSSGIDLPEERFDELVDRFAIEVVELPAGDKAILSLNLPAEFVIVFEPVTHAAQFIDVKGEPTRERQQLSLVYDNIQAPTGTMEARPGPLRLMVENRTDARVLPSVLIVGEVLHDLLGRRKPFMTAKRLLTNQTFRDIHRTDTLNVDQRLKITSLTFLFTDLRGSTALYERVGDLAAFDMVRAHFKALQEIVATEAGAVVKTIGDAVMATFPTPDRAMRAALRMREAMDRLNALSGHDDLRLKIGLHEGPCLAVTLNDRQDYFGQTVNIASRVQGSVDSRHIHASAAVVGDAAVTAVLEAAGLSPRARPSLLRGIAEEVMLFEIP